MDVLRLWQKAQQAEQEEWGEAYTETGAVFTNEDGTKLMAGRIAQAYDRWVESATVPTIRFHDLRDSW